MGTRNWWIIFAAAYALALLLTIPARLFVPEGIGVVSGTLWHGRITATDRAMLAWRLSPGASLRAFRPVMAWQWADDGALLSGQAAPAIGGVSLRAIRGTVQGETVSAFFPALPFRCTALIDVAIDRWELGGNAQRIRGTARSGPALCAARQSAALSLPLGPLVAEAKDGKVGSRFVLTPADARRQTLLSGSLAPDGRWQLVPTAQGAALLPFAGLVAGSPIDFRR